MKLYGPTKEVNQQLVLRGRYDLVVEPFMRVVGVNDKVSTD